MHDFKKNKCRLCRTVFCCGECRKKHEKTKHDINPECDVCVYGKVRWSTVSSELVEHILRKHWPLHCQNCKKLFGSLNDLSQQTKCTGYNVSMRSAGFKTDSQKSLYTPTQIFPAITSDSSPLISQNIYDTDQQCNLKYHIISNLATSTPMQREDKKLLEKIHEVIITPEYYYSENSKNEILKKGNSDSNQGGCLIKRRVTFGETPLNNSLHETRKMITASENVNEDSSASMTSNSGIGLGEYYTAKEEQSQLNEKDKKSFDDIVNIPSIKVVNATTEKEDAADDDKENKQKSNIQNQSDEENIEWMSAMNISSLNIDENGSSLQNPNFAPFLTPVVPNHRIKQVSIVTPTSMMKKEMSIKCKGPVQISSTPNSSIIPIKSAPKHRDIFRCEESLPSSSSLNIDFVRTRDDYQNDIEYNGSNKLSLGGIDKDNMDELSNRNCDVPVNPTIWVSLSNIVKNVTDVIQGFSRVGGTTQISGKSLKRQSSDYDFNDGPNIKRFKLTELKCRRTIREIPPTERFFHPRTFQESNEIHINLVEESKRTTGKTFADKATQTDENIHFPQNDQIL